MIVDYRDRLRQSLPIQTLRTHILMTTPPPSYDQFDPCQYLNEYYAELPPENLAMLGFLTRAFADVPSTAHVLDFGAGPMLYTAITGAHRVREMHLCEYLPANRDELTRWLSDQSDAFDWRKTIREVLRSEGFSTSDEAVSAHESLIRERVTRVMACDLLREYPLEDESLRGTYDVLVSNMCAEAVSPDLVTWNAHIAKFAGLLKPSGQIILTVAKQSSAYSVGKHSFTVLPLNEDAVIAGLHAAGFAPDSINIDHAAATHSIHPYEGLIFATARKP